MSKICLLQTHQFVKSTSLPTFATKVEYIQAFDYGENLLPFSVDCNSYDCN